MASVAAIAPGFSMAKSAPADKPFNLNFAPHDGMFKNHAGNDFVDQIKFMHEMGFRSIEDNGMLGRSKEEQEKIGNTRAIMGKFHTQLGSRSSQRNL